MADDGEGRSGAMVVAYLSLFGFLTFPILATAWNLASAQKEAQPSRGVERKR